MLADAGMGDEVAGELSRGDVLVKGALAVGALYGLGAVGPYVSRALAAEGEGGSDVDVLNYLLSFEYLQVSLYNRTNSEVNDKGEKMRLGTREKALVELFLEQDGEHVAALKKMVEEMGGEPAKKGSYAFAFRIFVQALGIAAVIEAASVGAYNGAVLQLESDEARELVYSIVQTDARHTATVRIGGKEEPTPEAFDRALPEKTAIVNVVQFTGVYPEEEKLGAE